MPPVTICDVCIVLECFYHRKSARSVKHIGEALQEIFTSNYTSLNFHDMYVICMHNVSSLHHSKPFTVLHSLIVQSMMLISSTANAM